MCGIVGYIGSKQAYPILIKGLKRLEYRGYDSAGVGLISHESKLNVYKAKGKVSNLEDTASQKDTSGHTGIYNPQIEMFARFKMKSSFHKTKRII